MLYGERYQQFFDSILGLLRGDNFSQEVFESALKIKDNFIYTGAEACHQMENIFNESQDDAEKEFFAGEVKRILTKIDILKSPKKVTSYEVIQAFRYIAAAKQAIDMTKPI